MKKAITSLVLTIFVAAVFAVPNDAVAISTVQMGQTD
jgi:hypothetical protein